MKREIVKFGADVLRAPCKSIDTFDENLSEIIENLFDSMRAAEGVGLAAPQIGFSQRVCVVDVSKQQPDHGPVALINPHIVVSEGEQIGEEGCLSFPDLYGDVKRYESVKVEALDKNGQAFSTEGSGFYARALQHELDHLNGILFVDHLKPLKRQLMRNALKRLKKEGLKWQRENKQSIDK
ncbi:MAG: peptide deformylase [Candidatus Latescibacterota bacterium]|nr:peptide deformylase [Candidatus Latescibacterota bacterium]